MKKSTLLIASGLIAVSAVGCGRDMPSMAAPPRSIQSFDSSRNLCDASFVAGGGYAKAREILSAAQFTFGAGVPTVTPEALSASRIFVTGELPTEGLSGVEICRLEQFVLHGGAVLDTRNLRSASIFGVTPQSFGGDGLANPMNGSDPDAAYINSGVADKVNTGADASLDFSSGVPFLADDAQRNPVGILFPRSSQQVGRAAVVGDDEIFQGSFGTCPGQPDGLVANNQKLLSNLFDWLAEAPGLDGNGMQAIQACGN